MAVLTSTAAGDAYTLSALSALYQVAGFRGVALNPIPMSPHTIVTGVEA